MLGEERLPPPPLLPMTAATSRNIANGLVAIALVLIVVSLYGMLQTPRPAWTRDLGIPVIVLAVAASGFRRRSRQPDVTL